MSLDKLAVIFVIIILPISVVLQVYTNYQVETLNLQMSYDKKLNDATRDALKAYQLNAFNESTSDLSASKMRDIRAAANAFFNSISANFNINGYNKEVMQEYVPALVFTMYDGYYIYSKYTNTLEDSDYTKDGDSPSTYTDGQLLYGINPFVSYSCRYKYGNNDFVISYTLDNYISIQGVINGNWIHDAGYLIDVNEITYNPKTSSLTYRGKTIKPETILKEKVGTKEYPYQKVNGVKYYYDKDHKDSQGNDDPKWFSMINGVKNYPNVSYNLYNDYSAYNYYKDAYDFTLRIKNEYKIDNLTPNNADASIENDFEQTEKDVSIFKSSSGSFADGIEEPSSRFNQHRWAVIKYTIEKNLSIAIKNYNKFDNNVEADFEMPKLEATEWDKIQNNITLISFLQGMPIGGKIYNGVCVVPNNVNNEVVTEKSIYIGNKNLENGVDKYYYSPLYKNFEDSDNLIGILNIDLERRSIESEGSSILPDYYYPKEYLASYDSIVNPTENINLYGDPDNTNEDEYAYNGNIYKYMQSDANSNMATKYFTALAREKYSTYKANEPYKLPDDIRMFDGNNHKYYLFKDSDIEYYESVNKVTKTKTTLTWHNAEAYCESLGGHLVTINSEREQEFIKNYIEDSDDGEDIKMWIGLIKKSGSWKWITGENSTNLGNNGQATNDQTNGGWAYRNWGGGMTPQPAYNGKYATIRNYSDSGISAFCWSTETTENASDDIYFICEWEV